MCKHSKGCKNLRFLDLKTFLSNPSSHHPIQFHYFFSCQGSSQKSSQCRSALRIFDASPLCRGTWWIFDLKGTTTLRHPHLKIAGRNAWIIQWCSRLVDLYRLCKAWAYRNNKLQCALSCHDCAAMHVVSDCQHQPATCIWHHSLVDPWIYTMMCRSWP